MNASEFSLRELALFILACLVHDGLYCRPELRTSADNYARCV